VRTNAQVKGRWHDNRHTLITDLAESGAGDQTIMDIAGHVSKQMLKHYSHIRMEAKRHALEAIVTKRPATEESGQEGQAEGYPQKSPHGLQNGGKRTGKKQAAAKDESSPAAGNAENLYSETPTNTQHFDVGYPQKSPQSGISEDHRGVKRGRKSKILFGSSGRTRINSQTHFQQHAGQRMTPKTMKSSRNPINRAQMERVFAASLPLDSRLQLIVRSEVIFSATSNRECRA
jgi:hypothetical protein